MVVVIGAPDASPQLFFSDKLALRVDGRQGGLARGGPGPARDDRSALHPGRPAQAEDRRGRHRRAQRLRLGRSQKKATVCATTGIMHTLSPAELEGVMAHELAHVKNRDVLIMTIASFFASVASMIMQFAFFFGGGGTTTSPPSAGDLRRLRARLRHLLLPDAGAVALPRVRRRPRRRPGHRPPERAGLGAHDDLRRHGAACPSTTCARPSA